MHREGRYLFTSESVTEGHPDKIADQISDAILDAVLEQDSASRVACETLLTTGLVLVAGEITTQGYVDIPRVARDTIREVGYTRAKFGFDHETCAVLTALDEQSPDIAMGVNPGGAGDQGMMFGFACRESPELMPLPIMLAHRLVRGLSRARREEILPYLRPDGKSQVTVEYEGYRPVRIDTVIVSCQHDAAVKIDTLREEVKREVIMKNLPGDLLDGKTMYHINPTGRFAVGAGVAERAEVQLAYAIGVADPVSLMVDTFGTGVLPQAKLQELVRGHFRMKPREIIEQLNLLRPIYRATASYGHFGRTEPTFTWEKVDKAEAIRSDAGIR